MTTEAREAPVSVRMNATDRKRVTANAKRQKMNRNAYIMLAVHNQMERDEAKARGVRVNPKPTPAQKNGQAITRMEPRFRKT